LAASAIETLEHALQDELGRAVQLVDVAVPADELTRADGDLKFVARLGAAVRAASAAPHVNVCVTRPARPDAGEPADTEFDGVVGQLLAGAPQVTTKEGDAWRVRFQTSDCAGPPPPSSASAAADAAAGAPGVASDPAVPRDAPRR
jgi:hypothetical protein